MSTSTSNRSEPVIDAVAQFLAQYASKQNHQESSANNSSSDHTYKFDKIVVALSGGKDSVCLLDALANLYPKEKIEAVYIDHDLQAASKDWRSFNKEICDDLGISYHCVSVSVNKNEASLEQAARNARYKALQAFIGPDTCLVTAQHRDDQAETFLLQLFRGAGAKGLSGMPYITRFAKEFHARPLLNVSQQQIEEYMQHRELDYINDPSNLDLNIRRNFLRHKILPALKSKWSGIDKVLAHSATTQAETQKLLDEIAENDLSNIQHANISSNKNSNKNTLLIDKLNELSMERQNNAIRFWLERNQIKMPSRKIIGEIRMQFLHSSTDSNPMIKIGKSQLIKYRNTIYLIDNLDIESATNLDSEWDWDASDDFKSPAGLTISLIGFLQLNPNLKGKSLKVSLKNGGERLYINGNKHGMSLKNYFQEKGVPPWMRDQTLLVWDQDKVIFAQEKMS